MNNYKRTRGFEYVGVPYMKNYYVPKDEKGDYDTLYTHNGELRGYYDFDLPCPQTTGAAASDVYSPIDFTIPANDSYFLWTDVKSYMLRNEVLIANVRSNQGKLRLRLANTQGWIDQDYYSNPKNDGNIGLEFINDSEEDVIYKRNDRIAQLMFVPCLMPDNPAKDVQRQSGYGSTGV